MDYSYKAFLLFLSFLVSNTTILSMELRTVKTKKQKIKLDIMVTFHFLDKAQLDGHVDHFKRILTESNSVVQRILDENNQCSKPFSDKNISQLKALIKYQDYISEEIDENPLKVLHDLPEYSKLTLFALSRWENFIEQKKVDKKMVFKS